ncbi:MAG: hypothetical protein H6Q90_5573 [Deltaproteobacteria bacterium]|nr:hypothetical protein [Deltaproteobacteria bacterium]
MRTLSASRRWLPICALVATACSDHGAPDHAADAQGQDQGDAAPSPDAFDPLAPPPSRFGIGLVAVGTPLEWDRASELVGPGGWIKLIFAGITPAMHEAPPEWQQAITEVYARDLIPVIRFGPDFGDRNVRKQSNDGAHHHYEALASAYAAVVGSLPRRPSWPLVVELHNEPDLCYEWACDPGDVPARAGVQAGWLGYEDAAAEYAAFVRDTSAALHALGDHRVIVLNGGLAPGGARACECGGEGFVGGITSLDFLRAMQTAVPEIWNSLDGFASHAYPASGEGFGFFPSYDQAKTGLYYDRRELAVIGRDLPVYVTETGWTTDQGARGSREDIAAWTRDAYTNDWLVMPEVRAVMPFILASPDWNSFAWISDSGGHYPVFDAVRDLRLALPAH